MVISPVELQVFSRDRCHYGQINRAQQGGNHPELQVGIVILNPNVCHLQSSHEVHLIAVLIPARCLGDQTRAWIRPRVLNPLARISTIRNIYGRVKCSAQGAPAYGTP